MNRNNSVPPRNGKSIPPVCQVTDAVLYRALIDIGRDITCLTAIAERQGDYRAVDMLLREKDRIHRLRRELSNGTH
jgi:hypothetical protein